MSKAAGIKQSIVVPASGDCLRLEWLLAGLARQEKAPKREVLIVADAIETDIPGIEKLVQAYQSRQYETILFPYLKSDPAMYRPASARNQGIRRAQGEQIIFLDEDCVPDADFCAAHWAARDSAAYGLRRRLPERHVCPLDTPNLERSHLTMYSKTDPRYWHDGVDWTRWYTCNASAPRKVLVELGGFDPTLDGAWGAEDVQLASRMVRHGVKFAALRGRGRVTHLDHPQRTPRTNMDEVMRKSLAGEYPLVVNSGPLEK